MNAGSTAYVLDEITCDELGSCLIKYTLIDVRSPLEFETERIEGAQNFPIESIEDGSAELPPGELVMICRSGKRAQRAAFALLRKGRKTKVLNGGLLNWMKAGLPVKTGKRMLSIERQIQLTVGICVLSGVLLGAFVDRLFLIVPAFFACGLTFAGLTGTCGLGLLLAKAPWNKLPGCHETSVCCK